MLVDFFGMLMCWFWVRTLVFVVYLAVGLFSCLGLTLAALWVDCYGVVDFCCFPVVCLSVELGGLG